MTLIVKSIDVYDDSGDRDAWKAFCLSKGWEIQFGGKIDPIDGYICTTKGKIIAVELAHTSVWTTESEFPAAFLRVPARKFPYFQQVFDGVDVMGDNSKLYGHCGNGWLVLLNTARTVAGLLPFKHLVRDVDTFFTEESIANGEQCAFKLVPANYIKKYVSLKEDDPFALS